MSEDGSQLAGRDHGGRRSILDIPADGTEIDRDQFVTAVCELSELFQQSMREMIRAEDEGAICEIAVETADEVLDLPLSAIWLLDDQGALKPVAVCDEARTLFDDLPTYTDGDSLSWQAYENGEQYVIDDVREADDIYNPETPIRSEILVPIGDHGVINSGSTELEAFDGSDAALANLLAENTAAALDRAAYEREFARQTDRMEFFASILRHAVLNGMTVIRSRASVLAAEVDDEHVADLETIMSRCDDITEVVQRVRNVLDTLTAEDDRPLHPVDLGKVLESELASLRATAPEVTIESTVPAGTTVRADTLLSDVLGNVLRNAVEHNESDDLQIDISVETDTEVVTVRVADDGVGIPDERKEAVFRREATGHAKTTGSGFGLFFVEAVVTAYGGEVWIEDNEAGGTTVALELVRSSASTEAA